MVCTQRSQNTREERKKRIKRRVQAFKRKGALFQARPTASTTPPGAESTEANQGRDPRSPESKPFRWRDLNLVARLTSRPREQEYAEGASSLSWGTLKELARNCYTSSIVGLTVPSRNYYKSIPRDPGSKSVHTIRRPHVCV